MSNLLQLIFYVALAIFGVHMYKSSVQLEETIKREQIKFEAQQTVNELMHLYRQSP